MMVNARQPARQMRHLGIKHLAIFDWVECDLMILSNIRTHDNTADAMTNPLANNYSTGIMTHF
jgi:hypothetical protein